MSEETVNIIIGSLAVFILWAILTYLFIYYYNETGGNNKK